MSAESEIEDILLYLSLARERKYSHRALSTFEGAMPFFSGSIEELLSPEDRYLLPAEDMLPTSIGAWDVSIIARPMREDLDRPDPAKRPRFALARHRSVSPKEVRGKVISAAPYYVESSAGFVYPDGEYWGAGGYFGWRGGQWRVLSTRLSSKAYLRDPEKTSYPIRIGQSVAFARRWWWLATLRLDGGPSISLPTDPIGAQEIFRLRDLPEGSSRRSALLHWVAEHWRKRRNDPHVEGLVRAHLRGATEFAWNGLSVKLAPSRADSDRNEEEKARAAKPRPRPTRRVA